MATGRRKAADWLGDSVKKRAEKRIAGSAGSSVVVPINLSLDASQKVMSGKQVVGLLRSARTIAVNPCECRSNLNNCDAPKDVCVLLDSTAEKQIAEGSARRIDLGEALAAIREAEDAGLVHLIIHEEGRRPSAVCSCCPCCCQELNSLLRFGNLDAVLQSDYVVEKDEGKCVACGACVERCCFGAHAGGDGEVAYDIEKCFGCGLCVAACPEGALKLMKRVAPPSKKRWRGKTKPGTYR
jgi:NAD-dependent dihydropyrimidine dehydrogenase PreA subunit